MAISPEERQNNLWTTLSKEAADQLVQTLYLLIDEIQFSRYDGAEDLDVEDLLNGKQVPLEFNDKIPF